MTLAAPPELTELDARAIASRYGGIEEYARAVHNYDTEPYQPAWYEALDTLDRVAIICPPDTYKSTTVQLWIEQAIGRNHDLRILWLMNAKEQAEKRVIAIKQTIEENAVYQRAFGVRPNKAAKWTSSELFIERSYVSADPTLMATGFLGAYQGLHFDKIIIDDPTDQDDVKSPTTMEAQRQRLRGVLTDRLVQAGQIVAIFTRWAAHDLLPTLKEMGFTTIVMPIVADYPWGPTLSPRRFPPEYIEELRRDKGPMLWQLTYMCDTSALEGALIKREHLAYWDDSMIPDSGVALFMYIDPAASTKTSADYSAIATSAFEYKTRRHFLVDLWMGRVEVPDLRAEIVKRYQRTAGVVAVGIETVGFQLALFQDLRRQLSMPLVELRPRSQRGVQNRILGMDKDKTSRALYLDQLFTSGRLFLPPRVPTGEQADGYRVRPLPLYDGVDLETMLCNFGVVGNHYHDDGPDAIAGVATLAEASVPPQQYVSVRA